MKWEKDKSGLGYDVASGFVIPKKKKKNLKFELNEYGINIGKYK